MARLTLSGKTDPLFTGHPHLIVVVKKKHATRAVLGRCLPESLVLRAVALAKETSPGLNGGHASSLVEGRGGVHRISVAVLPDAVSRHNNDANSTAIAKQTKGLLGLSKEKTAVLLVLNHPDHLTSAMRAVGRCLPTFTMKRGAKERTVKVAAVNTKGECLQPNKLVRETVEAARTAARLVDTPPTDMAPGPMADEAKALLRGIVGVKITTIVGDKLLDAGLGAIHAVGRTALSAPRMLIARYSPRGAKGPHVALVGKGVTYDTGGLSIKSKAGMPGMKADMGGAAAVLGAFRALTASKHKGKVTLVLCLAENAVGPSAYKPDDVITAHSGLTVEINNTDAEGRLLLADGVSYAVRKLKADVVIDAATLTGAQMIATGTNHAAVVSNDDKLERVLVRAGQESGDMTHPLPFAPEFYKPEFKSHIADMRNSVSNRGNAQSSCAGCFIYWHIDDTKAVWGHIDMAGPAMVEGRATGYGVALLAEAVRMLQPKA